MQEQFLMCRKLFTLWRRLQVHRSLISFISFH